MGDFTADEMRIIERGVENIRVTAAQTARQLREAQENSGKEHFGEEAVGYERRAAECAVLLKKLDYKKEQHDGD